MYFINLNLSSGKLYDLSYSRIHSAVSITTIQRHAVKGPLPSTAQVAGVGQIIHFTKLFLLFILNGSQLIYRPMWVTFV